MLEDGGLPLSGTPVEGLNRQQYIDRMVEGYESEGGKVDRDRLNRMIEIKKQLYVKFSKQALIEGNVPADMAPFLVYIRDCFGQKWKFD
jgi:hypothetical protein